MKKVYLILATTFFLGACATTRTTPAPIVNGTTNPPPTAPVATTPVASTSTAKAAPAAVDTSSNVGDTSSSSTVSKATDDEDGTVVSSSTTPPPKAATKPVVTPTDGAVAVAGTAVALGGINWATPTSGKIVQPYSAAAKGVDVVGKEGQSVVAAYDGTVAYSGNGLKGYGNLVIIKHNNGYLTAYSHNKTNVVKEGDKVKRGQKIAELGKTESDRPLLHFELRKNGKPIDPTPIFK